MGGVEPPTSSLPRTRSNHLSYMGTRKSPPLVSLERETGLEPATPSLEGLCSSQLSYSRLKPFCVRLRAKPSNRSAWWRGEDSNLRRLMPTGLQPVPFDRFGTSPNESGPFESARARAKRTPPPRALLFTRVAGKPSLSCVTRVLDCRARRLGSHPQKLRRPALGAGEGTRTLNPRITNPMLYQLSYASHEKRGRTIDRLRPRWQAAGTAPERPRTGSCPGIP